MQSLSATQKSTILSYLDAGHSICSIASRMGVSNSTNSRLHSKEHSTLQKSIGGHPSKLSPSNIHHAQYLITTGKAGKAENAVQVTKGLTSITNQPLSA